MWLPYAVLAAVALLTAAIAWDVRVSSEANDRLRFENAARRTSSSVRYRLQTYAGVLRAGAGLFAADREVSREEFRRFVERVGVAETYPGIQGVGFTARVRAGEEGAFLESMRRQGLENFRLRPEGEREEYQPVTYIEPSDARNLPAVGFDMLSEGTRREAMWRARDTGRPAASARVTLVTETDERKQAGFLIYVPVYRGGVVPVDEAGRREALRGFVYAPFRADDLLRGIFGNERNPLVDFRVYDGDAARADEVERLLGDDGARGPEVERRVNERLLHTTYEYGAESEAYNRRPRFRRVTTIDTEGRPWTLVFTPGHGSAVARGDRGWVFVLLAGVAFGLALVFVTRSQARARAQSERAAAAARASENRFRTLVEQSPVSTQILSPDGRTLRVNGAWERLWGVTLEALGGYNLLEDPQLEEKGIAPFIRRGFAGEPTKIPAILYDPEESIPGATLNEDPGRWVSAVIYPVKDEAGRVREVVLIHEDITERVRAEEEVRRGADRLALALASARLGDWSWDAATDLIDLSGRAAEIFGVGPGPLMTWESLRGLLHVEDRERARLAVERAIAERGDYNVEYRVERAGGEPVWVSAHGRAVYDESGRVLGMHGVVQDVTARKRIEAELRGQTEAAERARREAEEASRLKDEFLATLSHELRTPLTSILGWAKLLRGGGLEPEFAARGLEAVERNAVAQTRLIGDLLDVSRIITGKLRLEPRPVELSRIVEAGVESVRPAADARGVRLEVSLDPSACTVSGDPDRLQQVVWNLLSNAVKFTPHGGSVGVRLASAGGHAEVEVSDTGRGIPAEFLPHVFDRFRQADGGITREHGGLGLGLAIARNLVELHGGTITAASPGEGLGSTFRFRLPLLVRARGVERETAGEAPAAPGEHSSPITHRSSLLEGLHVLVVDDDRDSREVVAAALAREGARVTEAGSAGEAFGAVTSLRPDVLVADIGMPGEDGYALIARVRALGAASGGSLPAAALTAYAREQDRERALAAGFQTHIAKPVEPRTLTATVARLAGR
jgi:PAS domain S-box-containing protein